MKRTFKYQTAADPVDLARYLEALAEGFAQGRLSLTEDERVFAVHPCGLVNLSVKVRRKDGRGRLSLEFTWPEEKPALPLLASDALGKES
ncbi:MAG: amphi-Trp domain-containing protein [Candidatus Adiutrix sp.]|nr:amphi-Trp domain-containing protein [Candidatus Adiutrix sp.]